MLDCSIDLVLNTITDLNMITYPKFFPLAQQPLVVQGLLNMIADTPHSVGLLWTSDQPDAESLT